MSFLVEVSLSVILISVFLVILFNQNFENAMLTSKSKNAVFSAISSIEKKNQLRYLIANDDVEKINKTIKNSIPNLKNFYPVVYNKTANTTYIPDLSNKKNVYTVEYIIAGDYGNYDPKILRVFLWD
ncbi:MAG: hypothetical protein QXF12_07475 [Candidatus Aenigmatarchaeota archaeon]